MIRQQLTKVASGFTSLSNSPPELHKAYLLKFLDSYAYFSFSLVFTLFLSDDFGMSDIQAGTIYGAWGALITIFGLFTGTVIDNLGVAKCLRIGFVLSFMSRVVILTCTSREVLLACLLITLPFSNCLGIPVLTVGIRRYTNEENRGFAFGLFYVVMNVGALVAGPLVDVLTVYYNEKADGDNEIIADAATASSSWTMTSNRAIILSGVVANFIAVIVAFTVREIKVDSADSAKQSPKPMKPSTSSLLSSADDSENNPGSTFSKFRPLQGSSYEILSDTWKSPNFRRYLVLCLLTINVRMVFRHMDATLPKYMIREFGENTPKGRVYTINPAIIIVLVPIIQAATTAVDPLLMIHRGTYISALSVFFLAISTSLPSCVLFVTMLSIGEAIWSPRLYDYTMSVAQEGREGTYMALSSAPLFLAKLPVGFLSGYLLEEYCPEHLEEGEVRRSRTMWLIIGLSTIFSPVMITLLWGYISGGGEKNDGTSANNGERLADAGEESTEDDLSEHSYQHKPLISNISLPRVRQKERPLV
eukprot:CAMPEP_0201599428 /NCGR_PEP_ID=MMETSP0492-20130828/880_1 /ASSEMBLY_ACC=CAM_ASM_000837 /TAXON_ID=420259 /ORGANISM="Thalassiosira gravida, Strain GMp14c1" /LENGTH=531 /DNA_ID=CAMNT_0048061997 /DNA_START=185 /DNA_END=1780 /DNA_ORIENTATION=-